MAFAFASNISSSAKACADRLCDSSITYPFTYSSCSNIGSIIALKMKGEMGSPYFAPLFNKTSVLDPLHSIVVFRLVYEFIIDSGTHFGSPRRFRAAAMAVCGTVSKALAMSSCIATSPFLAFPAFIVSFIICILLKQPDSFTKPFCLGENVITLRSFLSTILHYVRYMSESIVRGL